MVIIKTQCYSKNEIEKLKEEFEFYIKTVIDIQNKTCIAGMNMHYDGEKTLRFKSNEFVGRWHRSRNKKDRF